VVSPEIAALNVWIFPVMARHESFPVSGPKAVMDSPRK
jgi:hypothetical protein